MEKNRFSIPTIIATVSGILVLCFSPLQTYAQGLADSAWPMFRQNTQHTGRSNIVAPSAVGTPKWKYQAGNGVSSSPAIAPDGTIYVGSYDKHLYALNSDGSLKWKYLRESTLSYSESSPAIASDGTIYVGSGIYVYAINQNGTQKWVFPAGYYVSSSPTIAPDGTIYVGSDDTCLYAINTNGTLKWKYQTGYCVSSSPAIASDGTIYVGSRDNYLYAINPNGTLKWKYFTGAYVYSSPAIASDGTVYVGSGDYLNAINQDGTLKWNYQIGGIVYSSPAIAPDGTIYVGSDNNYLNAINPNGTLKWQYQTVNIVHSSPAIASDGIIYVGSDDTFLYAINPNGTLKWKYQAVNAVHSSPAIASDGTIYVGSLDGYLFAFSQLGLSSPKGGETWISGTTQTVYWESTSISNVKLEYSTNNGSTWTIITASTSAVTGSYTWTVPSLESTNCLVRVSDVSNPSITAHSHSTFTIKTPRVTVSTPNGGENWTVGTSQIITWTSSDVNNVKIECSTNNGSTWTTISASSVAAVGSYTWTVPNTLSIQCLMKISSNTNTAVNDESNSVFRIIQPAVTLTTPNGGELWVAGTVHNITWASPGITNVNIEYSVNNGSTWTTIVSSTSAPIGSYPWTVPALSSPQCLIRVSDASNVGVNDQNNAAFTILGTLGLTSPNDGESWPAGSTHNITWNSSGISNVKLEYSANNGSTWAIITESTAATAGSYAWTTPVIPGTNYLVRVSDASNSAINDQSNSVFTISPSVTVISPNGGESWAAGTTHNITWNAYGVENVKLQYSTNNGTTWITLTTSTGAAAGSYSWPIPVTPGTQYLVRVSDATNATIYDQSNAVFKIVATVTVTAPNGGEQWIAGTTEKITWTSTAVDTVRIEYSPDGVNWSLVSPMTISSGSYSWSIPANYTTTTGRIRITDAKVDSIIDTSDEAFSIINVPVGVSVSSPNGGERWIVGTTQNITWTASRVANVKIEYSANNGANWTPIVDSTSATTGTYAWAVPNLNSANCLVRVSDATNAAVSDVSNAVFTILPVTVALTSPNGGERWVAGKTYPIAWTQQNVANVKIEYSSNGGAVWTTISASTGASAGTYPWTVPDASSTTCMVKVSDTSTAVRDSSDAAFTIVRPVVTLAAPNGGESWTPGSQRSITWTSTDVDSVKVEYSVNGGNVWTVITDGIPAGGGYLIWMVPNTPSTNCLVRVKNRSGLLVSDQSNAVFTIPPVTISMVSPNGGEQWYAGESHAITWESVSVTSAKLEYTTDGSAWVEIATNLNAATGTYSWTIPAVTSNTCRVRITNLDNLTVTDQSDSDFTIINPVVSLTSPNGGEEWAARRTIPITWESTGIPVVKLEYSTDNGVMWILLANNIDASARTYSWKIPETLSAKCLIRITDMANTSRSDVSDAVFGIVSPPALQVTAPNGGESLRCAGTREITWTVSHIDTLRIEYTLNGGQMWTTLVTSIPASTGTYQWKLPDETSSQCLIRITDVSDSAFTDTSDAPFSILRHNLNAGFVVDTDLRTVGNQGKDTIETIGGGKLIGFALYAKEWENAKGFTIAFSWNPAKAEYRSSVSYPFIVDDEITINGATFVPGAENNILPGSLMSVGEDNRSGYYTKSFVSIGSEPIASSDGLIFFAVFRTTSAFTVADTLSIRASVRIADDKGVEKDLGVRFFSISKGLLPPSLLTVADVPNDQGHSLRLSWAASPSEADGSVGGYRIFRSRSNTLTTPIPLSRFASLDSLLFYEERATILIDSVTAGVTSYTDSSVPLNGKSYYYWLQAFGSSGASKMAGSSFATPVAETELSPNGFRLSDARPNPFNPTTTIEYTLPVRAHIVVEIHNVGGQKVASLVDGIMSAGTHSTVWDARGMPSGVYFYTLRAELGFIETKKVLLLK